MENSFSGKTFIVSGATSGIGLAVAENLVRQGAMVIGIGRSAERCREAERRLRYIHLDSSPASQASTCYCVADLSLQSQIRSVAEEIREIVADSGRVGLDGLINNAGTFTYWLTLTPEGFEMQWAVNHLAPFLLTQELLPLLQSAPRARVVTVSSDSHFGVRLNWADIQLRRHYDGLRAYGQTKLANVLFTLELNRRLGAGSNVRAFAADPGLVKTDIGLKGNPALVRWVWARRRSGGVPPEVSARGIVFLAGEPSIQETPDMYWKDGAPKQASREALNLESAQRLWELSERMCGIRSEPEPAQMVFAGMER
jgi:NAD(P)-dependent dehydrogenase (short-subunit alcohol dehydrogenase family)